MGSRFAYLYLIMTQSKGQGQGNAQLDSKYLGNGERYGEITIEVKQQVT